MSPLPAVLAHDPGEERAVAGRLRPERRALPRRRTGDGRELDPEEDGTLPRPRVVADEEGVARPTLRPVRAEGDALDRAAAREGGDVDRRVGGTARQRERRLPPRGAALGDQRDTRAVVRHADAARDRGTGEVVEAEERRIAVVRRPRAVAKDQPELADGRPVQHVVAAEPGARRRRRAEN